jgi:hypothetical protein
MHEKEKYTRNFIPEQNSITIANYKITLLVTYYIIVAFFLPEQVSPTMFLIKSLKPFLIWIRLCRGTWHKRRNLHHRDHRRAGAGGWASGANMCSARSVEAKWSTIFISAVIIYQPAWAKGGDTVIENELCYFCLLPGNRAKECDLGI